MFKKKVCSKCGKKLRVKKFYKDVAHVDGLSNNCKTCQKMYSYTYYNNKKREKK